MQVYQSLLEVSKLLVDGSVGVIPTDTVYGIVALASNKSAVTRIYDLKRREGKPGTIIAASIEQLVDLGFKKRYLTVVEQFWPGPVSVVIPCVDLDHLHQGLGSIPVRIPDNSQLLELLQQTGPLQTSSANLTGEPISARVQQAVDYFGDGPDFYVDGGDLSQQTESTVIRVVDDVIEVIREGAVKINEQGEIAA